MSKTQNIVISCCFFAVALLLAIYGAGFSWRTAILAGAALFLLASATNFGRAPMRRGRSPGC
jgi:xanthine/uracil permease